MSAFVTTAAADAHPETLDSLIGEARTEELQRIWENAGGSWGGA